MLKVEMIEIGSVNGSWGEGWYSLSCLEDNLGDTVWKGEKGRDSCSGGCFIVGLSFGTCRVDAWAIGRDP